MNAALLVLCFAVSVAACKPNGLPPVGRERNAPPPPVAEKRGGQPSAAYRAIASSPYFAVGRVGIAGAIGGSEKGVWDLIKTRDRVQLIALTKERNPEARLYGLLGLRYLGDPEYKAVAAELHRSTELVGTLHGCLMSHEAVAPIADDIARGGYINALKRNMEPAPGPTTDKIKPAVWE